VKTPTAVILAMLAVVAWHAHAAGEGEKQVAFALSVLGGADYSNIEATGDMAIFYEPIPGRSYNVTSPAFGVQGDIMFGRVFGVALGLGYDRRGMTVSPTTVEFRDDPFEHELEARLVASHITLDLTLKAGYRFERHWVDVMLGVAPAMLWSDSLYWEIDGKRADVPAVVADGDLRVMAGIEYGYRYKRVGVFANVSYRRGTTDIAYGLEGTTRSRAFCGRVGVRYFFGSREGAASRNSDSTGEDGTTGSVPAY
jgi:hypothetical protein